MNEKTIKALVEAGAIKKVLIIAAGSAIHVEIVTQGGQITATTNKGSIKTWASLDASARWIKKLGLGTVYLEIGQWQPGQKRMNL